LNRDDGDCYIVTGTPIIDDLTEIIIKEYIADEDFIDWFVYEKYLSGLDENETFEVDCIEYKLTVKNFYKALNTKKETK